MRWKGLQTSLHGLRVRALPTYHLTSLYWLSELDHLANTDALQGVQTVAIVWQSWRIDRVGRDWRSVTWGGESRYRTQGELLYVLRIIRTLIPNSRMIRVWPVCALCKRSALSTTTSWSCLSSWVVYKANSARRLNSRIFNACTPCHTHMVRPLLNWSDERSLVCDFGTVFHGWSHKICF